MNLPLLLGCVLAVSGLASAVAQSGAGQLVDRIDEKTMRAIRAMDASSKSDPSLKSPLTEKTFEGSSFATKTYGTEAFGGAKAAKVKTYETRSFFGIKNPWFGKKEFDADSAKFKRETASESQERFGTDAYDVRRFAESGQTDVRVASEVLPRDSAPRKYLGPEQPDKGIDQFTQNLQRDLSMDEVRELLNKGQKAK